MSQESTIKALINQINNLESQVKALQEENQALIKQLTLTQKDYNILKEKLNKIALILEV